VYYVSLKGVTGARSEVSVDLEDHIRQLKSLTDKPVGVGFGISRPEHVERVAKSGADAAIIGSALINLVEKHQDSSDLMKEVADYAAAMRKGLDMS
jgi:tryptophan synthase alpha chain